MGKALPHIEQLNTLITAYGSEVLAKLLDVSERSVQIWVSHPSRTPRDETLRTLGELFERHMNGEDVTVVEDATDYKDKYIASLERENARLQKDLDLSLGEVRHNILLSRATAEVTQNLVIEFLAKQRKMTWEELAVEVGKLNGERYQRIKEEGSFAYVGK